MSKYRKYQACQQSPCDISVELLAGLRSDASIEGFYVNYLSDVFYVNKPVKYLINYVPKWRPYRTVYNLTFSKSHSRKVRSKQPPESCHQMHKKKIT